MDHFTGDWHLTREESYGVGAGARFKVDIRPGSRFSWGDMTLASVEPPCRIVARGRYGKYGRTRTLTIWELEPKASGTTRVRCQLRDRAGILSDRINEALGGRASGAGACASRCGAWRGSSRRTAAAARVHDRRRRAQARKRLPLRVGFAPMLRRSPVVLFASRWSRHGRLRQQAGRRSMPRPRASYIDLGN